MTVGLIIHLALMKTVIGFHFLEIDLKERYEKLSLEIKAEKFEHRTPRFQEKQIREYGRMLKVHTFLHLSKWAMLWFSISYSWMF